VNADTYLVQPHSVVLLMAFGVNGAK
jgi:hypothetical protein